MGVHAASALLRFGIDTGTGIPLAGARVFGLECLQVFHFGSGIFGIRRELLVLVSYQREERVKRARRETPSKIILSNNSQFTTGRDYVLNGKLRPVSQR